MRSCHSAIHHQKEKGKKRQKNSKNNKRGKEIYIFIDEDLKNFIASLIITKKPKNSSNVYHQMNE